MNKFKYKIVTFISFFGLFLDQMTKFIIRNIFDGVGISNIGGYYYGFKVITGRGIEIIKDFFYIVLVQNTGGAWGIFSDNIIMLIIVSLLVLALIIFFIRVEKNLDKLSLVYYGFLIGGIGGNLIDRVINGYVTDFLNFYIFGYNYPVFNIADMLIVIGLILMIIDVFRGDKSGNRD